MRKILTLLMYTALFCVLFVFLFHVLKFPYSNSVLRAATPNSENSFSILIDADENILYLLKDGHYFKSYICATGKYETPSPLGCFKIIKKQRWGEGFGGYYLGLNCTWGNYGIHGTTDPSSIGYSSSHGCFRMYSRDAEDLYGIVPVGTTVVVVSGCYGAFGTGFSAFGPGMYGSDVKSVQMRLRDLGYYKGLCNGSYNAYGFREAIHRYQKDTGLIVSDTVTQKMLETLGFVMIE